MSLSIELLQQVDACCDRFESACRAGDSPNIEDFLAKIPVEARQAARIELEPIAQQYQSNSLYGASDKPSNPASRDEVPTTAAPPGSAGLHLRCPHCQGGVELLADAPLDQITCGTCGSNFGLVDAPGADDLAPRTVGRFRLLERLGVGGFGTVWRARDPELDRDVAVKIPRRGQLAPYEAELFFREARAAAQLAHPGIVPVHEVGRDETPGGGRSIYIVSELIHGEPLSDRLKRERYSIEEASQLLVSVAEALHYAHERGVIHRDLKPSNIMLDGEGKPHLMDFGLAKREVGEITMTVEGQVLGTPAYMSPEQAGGQMRWVDRRTDLYALGVMLFQMLTGELPFRGTAQSQIQQRQTDDPPSPRRLDPRSPLDLVTVCLKCLERDPNRRYSTSMEVAEELRRYLAGEPVLARPLSRLQRAGRWAKRRPASATALGLTGVLAIGGPVAAIVIATQNAEIAKRLDEREQFIQQKEQQINVLRHERDQLQVQIDGGDGQTFNDPTWRIKLAEAWLDRHGQTAKARLALLEQSDPRLATGELGLGLLQALAEQEADAIKTLTQASARLTELAEQDSKWQPLSDVARRKLRELRSTQIDPGSVVVPVDDPESELQAALGPQQRLQEAIESEFAEDANLYELVRVLMAVEPLPSLPRDQPFR